MASESIGMMEGAFFVSKGELIAWLNDILKLNITKVENMASGAAYCQLMDILFPGSIPMSRVNWMAKYDHEFVWNYKFLQAAFDKNNIKKHVEVDKLIKAKYQDNLEFFQWFKRFFDLNCGNLSEYNPIEKRKNAKTLWDTTEKVEKGERKENNSKSTKRLRIISPKANPKLSPRLGSPKLPMSPSIKKADGSEKIDKLEKDLKDARDLISSLEKEKEFYFNKLRTIEVYCDHHESENVVHLMDIQKILFASDSDVVEVNENGSIMCA